MGDWWLGVVVGGGFGVAYDVVSVLANRWALERLQPPAFVWVSVGGIVVRLAVALVIVALVVGFTRVHVGAFIGAFFMVFVLGLALEIAILHRAVTVDDGA